jgi:cytochrome c oxidase subunit II
VPVGRPIRVTVTSEDVIHSLYFPSFRTKIDAIPGRYTQLWFEATKTGTYHIFCTEYCGTNHSGMIGSVVVMEPAAYQAWLAGGTTEGTLAQRGERLFTELACNTCHLDTGKGRGPSLQNIVGKPVELADGTTVTADEGYLRESIINSQAKIVKGYQPLMPAFQGLVSEDNLVALVEYVKSLSPTATATPAGTAPAAAAPSATPANAPAVGEKK